MITKYTYYKNSNTGELVFSQEFLETSITGIPTYFYNSERKSIDTPDLKGFVKISEKTFNRLSKKIKP